MTLAVVFFFIPPAPPPPCGGAWGRDVIPGLRFPDVRSITDACSLCRWERLCSGSALRLAITRRNRAGAWPGEPLAPAVAGVHSAIALPWSSSFLFRCDACRHRLFVWRPNLRSFGPPTHCDSPGSQARVPACGLRLRPRLAMAPARRAIPKSVDTRSFPSPRRPYPRPQR